MPGEEELQLPQEVEETVEAKYGRQPEESRKSWNNRFNSVADKLGQILEKTTESHVAFQTRPSIVKTAEIPLFTISKVEFEALHSLAEIGAKATGGRKEKSTGK